VIDDILPYEPARRTQAAKPDWEIIAKLRGQVASLKSWLWFESIVLAALFAMFLYSLIRP